MVGTVSVAALTSHIKVAFLFSENNYKGDTIDKTRICNRVTNVPCLRVII